jgi:hypothetical protein
MESLSKVGEAENDENMRRENVDADIRIKEFDI